MKIRFFLIPLLLSAILFSFVATFAADSPNAESSFESYLPVVRSKLKSFILFFDDFSDPASGWLINDDGNIRRRYVDEEYEMLIRDPDWWAGALAPVILLTDTYSLEAEMWRVEGDTSDYGLVFDRKDWDNFYFLVVDAGGQWFGVAKVEDGTASVIIPRTDSSEIKADDAVNILRVDRDGNEIDVYINGEHLASADDTGFGDKVDIGFYMESDAEAPAIVRYDDFAIWNFREGTVMKIGSESPMEMGDMTGGGSCESSRGVCIFD